MKTTTTPKPKRGGKQRGAEPSEAERRLGHIARLLEQTPKNADPDAGAFLQTTRSNDPLAEHLGESFVQTITTGENDEETVLDEIVTEEMGGPFVMTSGNVEFAAGSDE